MKITDNRPALKPRRVIYVDLRPEANSESSRSPLVDDLHTFDRRVAKGTERAAEALLSGVRHYRKERAGKGKGRKHKGKKAKLSRIPLHFARGVVTTLEEAEGISTDARKALSASRTRATLRKNLKSTIKKGRR